MIDIQTPLRVAFIGTGQMARAHARALRRLPERVELVGCYDTDSASAAAFAAETGTTTVKRLDEMLTRMQPSIVHICTPAGMHTDVARASLEHGAHLYVEKPFVESAAEAGELLDLAARHDRLICAGHQLLADPAYDELVRRSAGLGAIVAVESRFSFNSPTLRRHSPSASTVAQLVDIVPHPLYSLIALLERVTGGGPVSLKALHATATSVDALLVAGHVRGRLFVDLVARPVASTLSMTGTQGTLTADFIRGCVTGVANPGTAPLEKAGNEVLNGLATAWRSGTGVVCRIARHGEYPGLAALFSRFHLAVRVGGASPTSPDHLRRVAAMHETIAAAARLNIATNLPHPAPSRRRQPGATLRPVVAVTGAGGFLGNHLVKALDRAGFDVWGVGRGADGGHLPVSRWIRADLSRALPVGTFDGASMIVHAAAATSGGYDSHQRHSIDASINVVAAAEWSGIRRIVYVSSLSVVEPPSSVSRTQSERTPLATSTARALGPYTWGKCLAEKEVVARAAAAGIELRVVRPGAFFDPESPEVPGLVGKRLLGDWHLALGRPSHPFAAIAVDDCARAIAWCAAEFDEAPPVVNLFDPELETRADLIARLRSHGWRARLVWFPISVLAATASLVRGALSLGKTPRPEPLTIWQVLRPRRFDPHLSAIVFRSMRTEARVARTPTPDPMVAA